MLKMAICTPGFKPVPAVSGGAVEQLTTYILTENEKRPNYDIDLYTCADSRLDNYKLQYTHIIQIEDKQKKIIWRLVYAIINRFYRLFRIKEKKTYIEMAIAKACRKKRYDIILVENNMNVFNRIAMKEKEVDMYFHLHNNVECGDLGKTIEKTYDVVRRAKKVITASDFVKQRVEKITGANNVITVHNCLDQKVFDKNIMDSEKESLRKKYEISEQSIVILFVGRMDYYKGALELIQAVNLLPQYLNIKCLVIGSNWFGSAEERRYQERVKMLAQLQPERYCFIEYIDYESMPYIYMISDIVTIPSRCEEVFGMVALEAMYMGKPVVSAHRGALPEVLDNECSLFVDEDNFVFNLAELLEYLCINKKQRNIMGQAGRRRAQTKFSNVAQYYEQINNILMENT